jgi:hypothetical protein
VLGFTVARGQTKGFSIGIIVKSGKSLDRKVFYNSLPIQYGLKDRPYHILFSKFALGYAIRKVQVNQEFLKWNRK